jgi:tripartite-type tricarboxylate transporter receptor subunit TctC
MPRLRFASWAKFPARLCLGFALLLASSAARAEPVKLVVPIPAGSAGDVLARVVAEQISNTEAHRIIIENRPGGSTLIGTESVARAAADGNTLLLAGTGLVINPHMRKTNYDASTSFEPICLLVTLPALIAVKGDSPYQSLADLFNAARAEPGRLTLASIGPASTAHIALEMLKRKATVDITFVPYPGTGPAVNALIGGHVSAYFGNYADVAAQLKAGVLRALVTTSPNRLSALPAVPTIGELGYDFDHDARLGELWYGLLAPAKTPRDTIARYTDWFTSALSAPGVRSKLILQGMQPSLQCGGAFAGFLRKQDEDYARAIRDANIQVE